MKTQVLDKKNNSSEILVKTLSTINNLKNDKEKKDQVKVFEDQLITIGKPSISLLDEILQDEKNKNHESLAYVLENIVNSKAINLFINALEDVDFGDIAEQLLVKIGIKCIPSIIKKIEYRIEHSVKKGRTELMNWALLTIGRIRCNESINFLNNLLDDYMSKIPNESFDVSKYDWKYRNVDFFFILESMVRQQDEKAIPHLKKAKDFFPKNYVDHIACQIAIVRIKKRRVEGFLPLEIDDISMPSGLLMNILSGGETEYHDTFDEDYGEYMEEIKEDSLTV